GPKKTDFHIVFFFIHNKRSRHSLGRPGKRQLPLHHRCLRGPFLTTPGQHSLENRAPCDAGIDFAKKLLVFEVVSFSFFLFSSLVAQGLKLAINLLNSKDVDEAIRAHINLKVLRLGMMGSAVGSVMGCLFLMLSMVNVIEIRLGMLSCGSKSAVHSVTALVLLVSSALLVYISTAVYAFLH
ncbi:hypothetical protein Gogos_005569, partial [Gossypium gossypioides]|nr:hypothetical protein [Gossypium gossypioides]